MRKIVIDARVIKHLGRDLITSSEVAVIELIKNSIDAKAQNINLRVYSNNLPWDAGLQYTFPSSAPCNHGDLLETTFV